MKKEMPEQYRITKDHFMSRSFPDTMHSTAQHGRNGLFFLPRRGLKTGAWFLCMVSDGLGWAHVSVSIPSAQRCPTWEEMCHIKSIFFEKTECVVQYHPSEDAYVNNHEHVLHLWQCLVMPFPTPDPIMVGIKGLTPADVETMSTTEIELAMAVSNKTNIT